MHLEGIVLIDKPQGWTSFDVVAKVRGLIKRASGVKHKVGHAGTLDPMATGLLILAIGPATKQIDKFMKLNKSYEAEVTLGKRSNTDDAEGQLSDSGDVNLSIDEIKEVLKRFEGEIKQTPPQFSAIKVNGKRAYKLAREGKEIELKERSVSVHLSNISFDSPILDFTAEVSSGTYIRSLARDIGDQLGCGGYLSGLRRTQIGQFSVQDAINSEQLNIEVIQQHLKRA